MFLSVRSFNNPHYIEQYFVRLRANKKLLFYYIYNIIYIYIYINIIFIYIIEKNELRI
jgi:hypothetical protein